MFFDSVFSLIGSHILGCKHLFMVSWNQSDGKFMKRRLADTCVTKHGTCFLTLAT